MAAATLGRALQRLGHRFTLFGFPHLAAWMEKEGVSCSYLPQSPALFEQMQRSAMKALSANESIQRILNHSESILRELPPALERAAVDSMVIDANVYAAGSVAEIMGLPYVFFFLTAIHQHNDPAIPPPIHLLWKHQQGQSMMTTCAKPGARRAHLVVFEIAQAQLWICWPGRS
jgi:hypothetical protein